MSTSGGVPTLRPRQQEVVDLRRDKMIYADPMGSGKTPTSLRWLEAHRSARTLIVAPTNVLRHWERQAAIWTPGRHFDVIPTGCTPMQRHRVRSMAHHLVIPYSVLRADIKALQDHHWDAVVFDEAHRLKGRTSQVHKAAERLSYRVPVLNFTTGSPILNRAEEAWSLMHLVNPRKWRAFWPWANEHFYIEVTTFNGRSPHPVRIIRDPRPGAIEAIRDDFGALLVMRSEDELGLELPDWVQTTHEVDLSAPERKLYDGLVKRSFAKLGADEIMTTNEVSKMTRLRQLSSDWSGLLAEAGAGTKVKAAADLIADIGRPTVVFVAFKSTAEALAAELGRPVSVITGDYSDDEREAMKGSFVSGSTDVLIGTYETLAEGVDGLQSVSHHTVMIDLPWTPEMMKQAVARLRRTGQEQERVYVHTIVARNTVDQTVARALEQKQDVIDAVLGRPLKAVLCGVD